MLSGVGAVPINAALSGNQPGMLAIISAILFGIAWIINATRTATNAWFSATDLLLLGDLPGPASGGRRNRLGPAPIAR
jgi:hypothetical protein